MLPLLPVMTVVGFEFYHVPPSKGMRLLHSPEQWGTGVGLMAGIPSFQVVGVKGPLTLNKESMVQFDVLGQRLRLIGKQPDMATITIGSPDSEIPHTTLVAAIRPISASGFVLVLNIESSYSFDTFGLKAAVEGGLWSCVDEISSLRTNPVLQQYRDRVWSREESGK